MAVWELPRAAIGEIEMKGRLLKYPHNITSNPVRELSGVFTICGKIFPYLNAVAVSL
jgi:hypothetical protein